MAPSGRVGDPPEWDTFLRAASRVVAVEGEWSSLSGEEGTVEDNSKATNPRRTEHQIGRHGHMGFPISVHGRHHCSLLF